MKRRRNIATTPTSCDKIAFPTKADAKRYIKMRRGLPHFTAKHVYKCPVGDHFHMTSQTARPR